MSAVRGGFSRVRDNARAPRYSTPLRRSSPRSSPHESFVNQDHAPGSSTPYARSLAYRARAEKVMPRGVSSSPRATQRPVPLVIARAEGAHVTDVDGRTYIDY